MLTVASSINFTSTSLDVAIVPSPVNAFVASVVSSITTLTVAIFSSLSTLTLAYASTSFLFLNTLKLIISPSFLLKIYFLNSIESTKS